MKGNNREKYVYIEGAEALIDEKRESGAKKRNCQGLFANIKEKIANNGDALLKSGVNGVICALMSFLFGRTPLFLDTYPLAIAFLCASSRKTLWIFAGAVASVFSIVGEDAIISPVVQLCSYASALIIRLIVAITIDAPSEFYLSELIGKKYKEKNERARVRSVQLGLIGKKLFHENIYLRMATACASAFTVSLYNMNVGGYRYYDLFSALFSMVASPAFVFVFWGAFSGREKAREKTDGFFYIIGKIGMMFTLVYCCRGADIFGISVAPMLAFVFSAYYGKSESYLYGAAVGFATGFAVSPIYAPAFILSALASGVLRGSGIITISGASACASVLWGVYIDGFSGLMIFIPVCFFGTLALLITDIVSRSGILNDQTESEEGDASEEKGNDSLKLLRGEAYADRMAELSKTFSSISESLYDITGIMHRPSRIELSELSIRTAGVFCRTCENYEKCHDSEKDETDEMLHTFGEILSKNGRIEAELLPEYIWKKCKRTEGICQEINTEFAKLIRRNLTDDKTELLAFDYDAISHILSDAIKEENQCYKIDRELTKKMQKFASRPDISIPDVIVFGDRIKTVFCNDIGKKIGKIGALKLRKMLSDACGFLVLEPIFNVNGDKISMTVKTSPTLSAEYAEAGAVGRDSDVSGDVVSQFEGNGSYFYSIISDGMGSGSAAAHTSELCRDFLYKMLSAGNKKETALKMLNSLIRAKNTECSAALDLLEIDLILGRGTIMKSGAAPSFVRRGDKLFKLESKTAPIGIMRQTDAESLHFDLVDGDMLIMLSDGVCEGGDESLWLVELLNEAERYSPKELADKIVDMSKRNGRGDDISAAVVKISKTA